MRKPRMNRKKDNAMDRIPGTGALMTGAGLAVPAFAEMMQIGAGALTCEACLALDAATRAEAGNAVRVYVRNAANADKTAAAAGIIKGLDDAQPHRAIEAACANAPAGTTVPLALNKTL